MHQQQQQQVNKQQQQTASVQQQQAPQPAPPSSSSAMTPKHHQAAVAAYQQQVAVQAAAAAAAIGYHGSPAAVAGSPGMPPPNPQGMMAGGFAPGEFLLPLCDHSLLHSNWKKHRSRYNFSQPNC